MVNEPLHKWYWNCVKQNTWCECNPHRGGEGPFTRLKGTRKSKRLIPHQPHAQRMRDNGDRQWENFWRYRGLWATASIWRNSPITVKPTLLIEFYLIASLCFAQKQIKPDFSWPKKTTQGREMGRRSKCYLSNVHPGKLVNYRPDQKVIFSSDSNTPFCGHTLLLMWLSATWKEPLVAVDFLAFSLWSFLLISMWRD